MSDAWIRGFPGSQNMAWDCLMIEAAGKPEGPRAAARIFLWARPAVSLPRKGIPGLDESALAASGVEVVRRPTGGGALIHGSDVSFSVAMHSPRGKALDLIESGRALVEPVRRGLRRLGFEASFRECSACDGPGKPSPLCFLQKTPFDLVVSGRKVAAFALRRTGSVLFIHGSVLVEAPPEVAVSGLARFGVPEAARWSSGGTFLASLGSVSGLSAVASAIAESNATPLFSPPAPLAETPLP